jgi:hypothetical protein
MKKFGGKPMKGLPPSYFEEVKNMRPRRFTPEQRIAIMDEAVTTHVEQKALAAKYCVSSATISNEILWASFDIIRLYHELHDDKAETASRLGISEDTVAAAYWKLNYT